MIDDHPVVRAGTTALVEDADDMALVGVAASLEEAAPLLDRSVCDVLLADLRLGSESGFRLMERRSATTPAVIVLTAYDHPQYVDAALRLGASGFVLKIAPLSELLEAIRRTAAGQLAFGRRPTLADPPLSAREREVVSAVVDGLSNDEVAARLGISRKTVEAHLGRLYERHRLASRTELATRALREGWLDLPPMSARNRPGHPD